MVCAVGRTARQKSESLRAAYRIAFRSKTRGMSKGELTAFCHGPDYDYPHLRAQQFKRISDTILRVGTHQGLDTKKKLFEALMAACSALGRPALAARFGACIADIPAPAARAASAVVSIGDLRERAVAHLTPYARRMLDMPETEFGEFAASPGAMFDKLGAEGRSAMKSVMTFLMIALRVGNAGSDTLAALRNDTQALRYSDAVVAAAPRDTVTEVPAGHAHTWPIVCTVVDSPTATHIFVPSTCKNKHALFIKNIHVKSPGTAAVLREFRRWAALCTGEACPPVFFSTDSHASFGAQYTMDAWKGAQKRQRVSCKVLRDACTDEFVPNTGDRRHSAQVQAEVLHDMDHSEATSRRSYGANRTGV